MHLGVTHIPNIVILAFFLTKLYAKEEVKTGTEAESIAPSVSPTVTVGADNIHRTQPGD